MQVFMDIETLPNKLSEQLMEKEPHRSGKWDGLMRRYHSVLKNTMEVLEYLRGEIDFGFRGGRKHAFWDPRGIGRSEERVGMSEEEEEVVSVK